MSNEIFDIWYKSEYLGVFFGSFQFITSDGTGTEKFHKKAMKIALGRDRKDIGTFW